MNVSTEGIDFIKSWEQLKLNAYAATADESRRGIWTIGYGSTYWPNGQPVKQGEKLADEAEAEHLFSITLEDFELCVCGELVWPIEQHGFDALVSLAFNIGTSAFRGSTLAKILKHGDYEAAATQFPRWNKQSGKVLSGLVRRREQERRMFLGLPFENNQ